MTRVILRSISIFLSFLIVRTAVASDVVDVDIPNFGSGSLEDVFMAVSEYSDMPDFKIEYWHEFGSVSSLFRRKCRFFKQDRMWRYDIWDEKGQPFQTVTFDGEHYYVYDGNLDDLVTSYRFKDVEMSATTAVMNNPLFSWALAPLIHLEGFCSKIQDPAVWAEALSKYKIVEDKEGVGHFESDSMLWGVKYRKEAGGMVVEKTVLRHKNPGGTDPRSALYFDDGLGKLQVTSVLTGWKTFQVGEESVSFPAGFETKEVWFSTKQSSGSINKTTYIEGSFESIPVGMSENVFRIPLSGSSNPRIIRKKDEN